MNLDHLVERIVLGLVLEAEPPDLMSEAEIAHALGSEVRAAHALVSLHSDGLIHRCNEFVFPTRGTVRFRQLEESPRA